MICKMLLQTAASHSGKPTKFCKDKLYRGTVPLKVKNRNNFIFKARPYNL
jgi:hypothetical protein